MIGLEKRYGYEQLYEQLNELGNRYHKFAEFRQAGESHDGRKIPMLQIGHGLQVLLCTAGIHGTEQQNPVLLLKIAEEYCQAYERNWSIDDFYEVKSLLDEISICIMPLVNPDGYEIAAKGYRVIRNPIYRQMLKMKQIPHELWKENARGIDIDRNFPCSLYQRKWNMEEPASENETRAVLRVMQEKETVGYLNFRSREKVIYYYRNAMSFQYNQKSHAIAKQLQRLSNYRIAGKKEQMKGEREGGNAVQYYAEFHKCPAITIETLQENSELAFIENRQMQTYSEIHTLPLEYLFTIQNTPFSGYKTMEQGRSWKGEAGYRNLSELSKSTKACQLI